MQTTELVLASSFEDGLDEAASFVWGPWLLIPSSSPPVWS